MSAYQIFTQPSQQALDTAANVLSGATLTFSLTGTSTPTDAYSDSALTTPVANPLAANAAGVWAPVFLDPAVIYRVVLKTQAGVVLQTWDPANENWLSAITQNFLGLILYPRTSAENSAALTVVNGWYPAGHAYRYGTNTTPGTTDMTTALNATLLQAYESGGVNPYWPAGSLVASTLIVTGSVKIRTEGYATLLMQKSGTTTDTSLLRIQASNVLVEEISVQGNISTDTGEHMHGIEIGGAGIYTNVTLKGVRGTNIRGDVIYMGGLIATPLYNVMIGQVNGTNIYRNVVSFVGVNGCTVESITGTQIGYRAFDVEPNAGSSQAPTGIYIGYCRGANFLFAGDPTINNGSVEIGYMDADNSLLADSSPGYPTHPTSAGNIGINVGNTQSLIIHFLRARGYLERLYQSAANTVKGDVLINCADISGCNTTEAVFKTLFNIDEKVNLRILGGAIALTALDRYVVKGNAGPFTLQNLRISGGAIATQCTNGRFAGLTIDLSSLAIAAVFGNCISCRMENISFTNAASATLLLSCTDNVLDTLGTATFAGVEGAACARNWIRSSYLNGVGYGYGRAGGQITTKAMADANQTISAQESAQTDGITTTGALTAQRNLTVPSVIRQYTIFNNCTGFGVQVLAATGTGIVIGVGKRALIVWDGANMQRVTADT